MNLPDINKVLFLDIETVPQYEKFSEAPELLKQLFLQKFKNKMSELENSSVSDPHEELWNLKAPLSAEFGKIVCISVGMMHEGKFVTKSFSSKNESDLLDSFINGKLSSRLNDISGKKSFMCVYNGEIFDLPFIAKRLIINGLNVPKIFFFPDYKPWERSFIIDVKNIWKWDVFDGSISLGLLGYSLGLEIHKDEIDGSMVKDIYYLEKNKILHNLDFTKLNISTQKAVEVFNH